MPPTTTTMNAFKIRVDPHRVIDPDEQGEEDAGLPPPSPEPIAQHRRQHPRHRDAHRLSAITRSWVVARIQIPYVRRISGTATGRADDRRPTARSMISRYHG